MGRVIHIGFLGRADLINVDSFVIPDSRPEGWSLVKFAMGSSTLGVLSKATSGSSDELSLLVRQLFEAAEPLEGQFQGAGRAAFDRFKSRTDEISAELKLSLDGVLTGITGMDRSFQEGEAAMVDETTSLESGSSFDAARFGAR
ncbi:MULTISPECIES: hypothetical protein [Microbacterium]|uniref:hypothetical protein n=1 Tax=Microbacterium TaxID=33882 RepID=UPI002781C537|nr:MULTISPECIES: hypothetical protein [Microbacterium]MDQ1075309.1 hypothetical protein [Microbacterium sp. SORGH_AS_0969]MDQ1115539.1 hypothetical protein [Microbacterium testaceum]